MRRQEPIFTGLVVCGNIEVDAYLRDGKMIIRASIEEGNYINSALIPQYGPLQGKYPLSQLRSPELNARLERMLEASTVGYYRPGGYVVTLWSDRVLGLRDWNPCVPVGIAVKVSRHRDEVDIEVPLQTTVMHSCALEDAKINLRADRTGSPTSYWLLAQAGHITYTGPPLCADSPLAVCGLDGSVIQATAATPVNGMDCVLAGDSLLSEFYEVADASSFSMSSIHVSNSRVILPLQKEFSGNHYIWHEEEWKQTRSWSPDRENGVIQDAQLDGEAGEFLGDQEEDEDGEDDYALQQAIRASQELNHAAPRSAEEVANKRARVEHKDDPPILRLKQRPKQEDASELLETRQGKECVICILRKRTHWSVGCAHLLYCDVCVHDVVASDQWMVCSVCNTRSRGVTFEPID